MILFVGKCVSVHSKPRDGSHTPVKSTEVDENWRFEIPVSDINGQYAWRRGIR